MKHRPGKLLPKGAKEHPWIRWRFQGGALRAYGELRSFGGGQPALIAPGEKLATTDPEVAEHLVVERVNRLKEERRNRVLLGINPDADLAEFCIHHIEAKVESEEYDAQWLDISETYLARAVSFFTRYQHATEEDPEPAGEPRNLATISPLDVRAYAEWLNAASLGVSLAASTSRC